MIPALLLAAAVSAAVSAASAAAAPPAGRVLDRVAGVVNGEVITLRDLEERGGPELQRVDAMPAGAARDRARASALKAAFDLAVAERLFASQVAAAGVEVSESEVDSIIEDVKKRNGLDDASLTRALAAQGMDREAYRKMVKRDVESMRLVQLKIRNKVKVTDEDVKHYWQTHPQEFRSGEEVRARHILVPVAEDASEAEVARARGLAEKAAARVRGGEDFGQVARQVSKSPSAADGGELGWLASGTMQPDLEKVVFALKPGEVSPPVRTRPGFQVFQVEERRGGQPKPLEAVQEQIRDRLTNEQGDVYRAQYVAELRKDAAIEVRMPELKD